MASIPKPLNGHVRLEVECLGRMYLNRYIGALAIPGGLVNFMREQLGMPIPSPVALGQVTTKFRDVVNYVAERERIPVYQFDPSTEWRKRGQKRTKAKRSMVGWSSCETRPPT